MTVMALLLFMMKTKYFWSNTDFEYQKVPPVKSASMCLGFGIIFPFD